MKISFSVIGTKEIQPLRGHLSSQCGIADGQDVSITFNKLQESLASAASYYANFSDWLGKVILEIELKKRSLVLAWSGNLLVGVNILKHTEKSSKLCTYWVHPDFRHQHLASRLLRTSLMFFSESDPLITIPEFVLGDFFPLTQAWKFYPEGSRIGLYQTGIREFFFRIPRLVEPRVLVAPEWQPGLQSELCSSEGSKRALKQLGSVRMW